MTYKGFRERYLFWGLLVSLLLSIAVTPLLDETVRSFNFFILAALVFSVCAIGNTRARLFWGVVLGVPCLIAGAVSTAIKDSFFITLFYGSAALFFTVIALALLRDIFKESSVNTNHLLSAICIYLCIAIIWSMLYGLVAIYHPQSFNIAHHDSAAQINDLVYFSIVTLSTLGYGDITPLSNAAKSLVAVEALLGQIYLTVLVARLVGLHIANKPKPRDQVP